MTATLSADRIVLQGDVSGAIQQTINEVINYLPTLVSALVVLLVGYIIGRLLEAIVTRVVQRIGVERHVDRSGVETSGGGVARALGKLVAFYVYFIAILTAADILGIAALSDLLSGVGEFLPVLFGALVILVVGFIVGRIVGGIVADVASGFDVRRYFDGTPLETLSDRPGEFARLVGKLVEYYVYLLTLLTVADVLDIAALTTLLNGFAAYLPALVGALLVLIVGIWLAEVVRDLVAGAGAGRVAAVAAKLLVYYITIAVVLDTLGVDISPLTTLFTTFVVAFFGALAIALAIGVGVAFGLGGRRFVRENIDGWARELRGSVDRAEVAGDRDTAGDRDVTDDRDATDDGDEDDLGPL